MTKNYAKIYDQKISLKIMKPLSYLSCHVKKIFRVNFLCVCICVRMYACAYIYIYIYI